MEETGQSISISPAWLTRCSGGGGPSAYAGSTAGSSGARGESEQVDIIATPSSGETLGRAQRRLPGKLKTVFGPLAPATSLLQNRGMSEFRAIAAGRSMPAMPVDEYLAELDRLIAAHDYFKQDRVIPAIGRGEASREVVQRLALEFYYLGRWMTPEFPMLIANAPDVYAFTMEDSVHYHHWAQN